MKANPDEFRWIRLFLTGIMIKKMKTAVKSKEFFAEAVERRLGESCLTRGGGNDG
jgi:hypothetical protein